MTKIRMLWATNMPAPYRITLWDEICTEFELQVLFGLPINNWRGWYVPEKRKWKYSFFSKKSFKIGEYELPLKIFGIKKYIKSQDVVIVGGWENPFYLSIIALCKYYKIPFFIFYGDVRRKINFFNPKILSKWILFKLATGIVSLSRQTTRNLISMGLKETKIVTLYNPHDQIEAIKSRRSWNNHRNHKFIFIGQLIERKSPIELFEAFIRIDNKEDTLTYLGSGKLQKKLLKKIQLSNFENRIVVQNPIDPKDVLMYLKNFDTLVLPSKVEIWGQVVNEAFALGLNIVVSENCGITDYIRDSEGVFVCNTDITNLSDCLEMAREFKLDPWAKNRTIDFTTAKFASLMSDFIREKIRI